MTNRFSRHKSKLPLIVGAFVLVLILLFILIQIAFWILIVIALLALGVVVWGVATISSNIFLKTISRFKTKEKLIALTFDDGPHDLYTPLVLQVLRKYKAKATFFCIGANAKIFPDLVLTTLAEGHEIGNHTYRHALTFPVKNKKHIVSEIELTNKLLEGITGEKPIYFRPPFGVSNPNIAKAVRATQMQTVGWSLRSLDTTKSPDIVLQRLYKAKAGDIILMHDNRKQSPEILEKFLRLYIEKGYKFVTISQALGKQKMQPDTYMIEN